MSLGFSDEVIEARIFRVEKSEFVSTLYAIESVLKRRVAIAMTAVPDLFLLPDLKEDVVGMGD